VRVEPAEVHARDPTIRVLEHRHGLLEVAEEHVGMARDQLRVVVVIGEHLRVAGRVTERVVAGWVELEAHRGDDGLGLEHDLARLAEQDVRGIGRRKREGTAQPRSVGVGNRGIAAA
jgi:hypothetical protein